jgi:hypothetical protein
MRLTSNGSRRNRKGISPCLGIVFRRKNLKTFENTKRQIILVSDFANPVSELTTCIEFFSWFNIP